MNIFWRSFFSDFSPFFARCLIFRALQRETLFIRHRFCQQDSKKWICAIGWLPPASHPLISFGKCMFSQPFSPHNLYIKREMLYNIPVVIWPLTFHKNLRKPCQVLKNMSPFRQRSAMLLALYALQYSCEALCKSFKSSEKCRLHSWNLIQTGALSKYLQKDIFLWHKKRFESADLVSEMKLRVWCWIHLEKYKCKELTHAHICKV